MRTIGVIGGMGPVAAADFYARVVSTHGALCDQDHPPCIMYSATQVPDRTAFLLENGADPTPELVTSVNLVETAGADFIAIPCNSAHAFLAAMRAAVSIPILDMIALVSAEVARVVPQARCVGVLAASGSVKIGLYDKPLKTHGLVPLYPDSEVQDEVMAAIKDVKAGGASEISDPRLIAAARHLCDKGADSLIMGCTEVPLALAAKDSPVVAIDGNQALVDTTLRLSLRQFDFEEILYAIR